MKSFLIYATEEMMVNKFSTPKLEQVIAVDTNEKEYSLLSNKFMGKKIGSTNEAKVHSSAAHQCKCGDHVPALLYEGPS